ncbi:MULTISPECIES: hypothetical protein [unclassified Mesorhizobium]|uniref:hypothetical protein n=1 Tax=unclassified Mesorhizobium TaxID=325217 RepID=UPI00112D53D1|nr:MULTISPECIES: hypothetical protein [unclassified Mesorhizobium]TPK42640.1 hypothetical protein FJ550_29740 [Mesorhizobium sp. B2-5-2]TPL26760.1 hypothetical protein FJ946_13060 [Mesorhizobium sp. B2-4-7]TPL40538.1 hypothetical protein FJ961_17360 [Mesorhizobium sp. B2-4-5]TPM76812.1 hypothetical protein FJ968_03590 [Mesorhizobium sp. B2-1-6]TPN72475.1 hypothetical protein FJ985_29245 [Mesorhizobium sp. B1-1-2]
MILVVLFTLAGAISVLFGFITMTTGNFNGPSIMAAAPVFLVALGFFGFAQVINALGRTAKATEASVAELKAIREQLGQR